MIENKLESIESSREFSLVFKLLAFILVMTFTFQSLHSINEHTYSTKGASIHRHDCTTPIHLSYFCQ